MKAPVEFWGQVFRLRWEPYLVVDEAIDASFRGFPNINILHCESNSGVSCVQLSIPSRPQWLASFCFKYKPKNGRIFSRMDNRNKRGVLLASVGAWIMCFNLGPHQVMLLLCNQETVVLIVIRDKTGCHWLDPGWPDAVLSPAPDFFTVVHSLYCLDLKNHGPGRACL